MALLAKQADDPAAQLTCTTNNKDHFLALHETAQFSPLSDATTTRGSNRPGDRPRVKLEI
jgi:hypothetical protein